MPKTRRGTARSAGAFQAKGAGQAAGQPFPQAVPPATTAENRAAARDLPGQGSWGHRDPPSDLPCGLRSFMKGGFTSLGGVHSMRIFDLAFHPSDGSRLASCGDDDFAAVWVEQPERARGVWRQAFALKGHLDGIMRVTWGPEHGQLATASSDTTVALWQLPEHPDEEVSLRVRPTATLRGHPEEVYACEFLTGCSGRRLLSASADSLYLWDLETGTKLQEISGGSRAPRDPTQPPGPEQGCIFGAKQCPGGSLVASPCSDGALRFWQVGAGGSSLAAACKVPLHQGMGSDVAFDPEGRLLLSLSRDGSLALLDVRMWAVVARHQAQTGLAAAVFLPGGSKGPCAVAAGQDGSLWGIDIATGGGFRNVYRADQQNTVSQLAVAVSADAQRIAYAGDAVDVPGGHEAAAAVDQAVGASFGGSGEREVFFTNNAQYGKGTDHHGTDLKPTRAIIGVWESSGLGDVAADLSTVMAVDEAAFS